MDRFRSFLSSNVEYVYAILRIVAGFMFALHGVQKLFHLWLPPGVELDTQAYIGGVIELVAGVMIALGAGTRYAAFIASGEMAVAYIQFHWRFHFDSRLLPIVNHGDDTLLYAFLFLFIACRGAGIWSVDRERGQ